MNSRWIRLALPALCAGWIALCMAACNGGSERSSRALYELERLSFIAPDRREFEGWYGPYADCSLRAAILVDLFEVTRADWLYYLSEPPGGADAPFAHWGEPEEPTSREDLERPATWMTHAEAATFASARGMRLLTAKEWIYVAVGRRRHPYPYGASPQMSWANTLELGLHRTTAVGTFESGRSANYGVYDLVGNVAEWVDGWVPAYGDGADRAPALSVLGGSHNDRLRRTYGASSGGQLSFFGVTVDPEHRAEDIGLRCAADAAEYLWTMADRWPAAPDAERRVRRVAEGWVALAGREAVLSVLEELAARPEAPKGLRWLVEGAR